MATDIQPTLDIDAALAIVRTRTPGEWQIRHGVGIGRTSGCESHHREFGSSTVVFNRAHELTDQDAAAIVAAVNNFESVAERCKRAEQFVCEVDRVSYELSKIEDNQQRELIIELTERCKRAEADARVWKENAELAAKACVKAMEQRDELFKACKHAVEAMGAHGPCTRHSCSDCKATWKELNALVYGVKGGADGQA